MVPEIKEGEPIICRDCGGVVYIAAQDIPYMSEMTSKLFKYPDGRPVEFAAELVCMTCGDRFSSISTERKETMR